MLREEAKESWQYAITDGVVYSVENVEGFSGDINFASVKDYASGRLFLELVIEVVGHRYQEFYAGIVESSLPPRFDLPIEGKGGGVDVAMLIRIGELINNPQNVSSIVIPSVVRLERLDEVTHRLRQSLDHLRNPPFVPVPSSGNDGELGSGGLITSPARPVKESELADGVVEAGSDVLNEIANDESKPMGRKLRRLEAVDVVSAIGIKFSRGLKEFSFKKLSDFNIESVQMFARPIRLHGGIVERVFRS